MRLTIVLAVAFVFTTGLLLSSQEPLPVLPRFVLQSIHNNTFDQFKFDRPLTLTPCRVIRSGKKVSMSLGLSSSIVVWHKESENIKKTSFLVDYFSIEDLNKGFLERCMYSMYVTIYNQVETDHSTIALELSQGAQMVDQVILNNQAENIGVKLLINPAENGTCTVKLEIEEEASS